MPEQNQSLTGKTVLITGGARRVGAAIARELHAAGANLAIHYRKSAADAEALAQELNGTRPGSAATVQAELLEVARLPALVEFAVRSFGGLDVLVNNASTFYATKVGEITPAAFDDLLGTNLKAPMFLSQAAAPALRKSHGLILNIVDIHALRPLRQLHRVLHGQSRIAHAHAVARQGTGTRNSGQWHLARTRCCGPKARATRPCVPR